MQFLWDFFIVVGHTISEHIVEILTYGGIAGLLTWVFLKGRSDTSEKNMQAYEKIVESGLTEPASLHPVIDTNLCIGCGTCVAACPEGDVLGVIQDHAHLINPTHCIGHGACKAACPMDAITLVFGTEKRGVEIPSLKPDFETNVSGIYIAGELGGMGLIRNAVTQGRQAMEHIIERLSSSTCNAPLDTLIIGAGPAGFSASLKALEAGINYYTIEQDSLGGAVFHFPRGKLIMTSPAELPIVGKVKINETRKEALLEFWQAVEQKTQVQINYHERMENIVPENGGLKVRTNKGEYFTKTVLLAIGRRGTPRKLGVPGEAQSKVVYNLIDPAQYQNMHVLVVGGGNSALEAATSIADEPGTTVTLSYRSSSFSRAAEGNRDLVKQKQSEGKLNVMLNSNVQEIRERSVVIEQQGQVSEMDNDAVIINAGGILPTPFLKKIGIEVETKFGAP